MERSEREALCERVIDVALAEGARYVEARVVRRTRETLAYRSGDLELSNVYRDVGIGVRALYDNGWGYSGTNVLTGPALDRAARAAVQSARATAITANRDVRIPTAHSGTYETPMERDPLRCLLRRRPPCLRTRTLAEASRRVHDARRLLGTSAGLHVRSVQRIATGPTCDCGEGSSRPSPRPTERPAPLQSKVL